GGENDVNVIDADPRGAKSIPVGSLAQDHADTVYGDRGIDNIDTGFGADTVVALAGADRISTGDGKDVIQAGDGDDTIDAGEGNDTIESGSGVDVINAGSGDDQISSGSGADYIQAGSGNDRVDAGEGDDFVIGGSGDDASRGGGGSDILWGDFEVISFADFRRDVLADFGFPSNFLGAEWAVTTGMPRLVPIRLSGRSVEGTREDGADRIQGDGGIDWIFGGNGIDILDGGADSDFLDGGAGNDELRGGNGDDIVRGGSSDDVVRGGPGIDQLFGDAGADSLFGDAGAGAGLSQILVNQRLFGGEGLDYLYGFSFSTDLAQVASERLLIGEELHGGAGRDEIRAGVRSDIIYGDGGNDEIQADALYGPNYAIFPQQPFHGGADVVFGGDGEDRIFGGGGDDTLWGGFDSDELDGQSGTNRVYGGSGIDRINLGINPLYVRTGREFLDGHFGNQVAGDTRDDNATDILLINGTDQADTILLSQESYVVAGDTRYRSRLVVSANSQTIAVEWRDFADFGDLNGRPLIEQFSISGLGGDDVLGFVADENRLDVTDLVARSEDWVGVLDGGPGNDTLTGSNARDRLD
ncbi:MAG: calcium-binding protein, partial [Planctomycetota bacterium]